ncbi:MAG: DUF4340 domain-containing protein [Clostridia bacterium]|nr:DUF4340 domain-containing protein [Clostridia bacterium]
MKKRIVLTAVCAVLCVGLCVALGFLIANQESTDDEGSGSNVLDRLNLISFSDVASIHIKNQHDEYKLVNSNDTLVIEGYEYAPLNNYKLMYLLSNACQTYYTYSAETTAEDMVKYGLADGENQAEFTVTTLDGEEFTVYIGDETLANDGYYVRTEGDEGVYVLGYDIEEDLLAPSEALINKNVVYGTETNTYYLVDNFELRKNGETFVAIDFVDANERSELAAMGIQRLTYPEGYFASDYYNSVLTKFSLLDSEGSTNFMLSEVLSYKVDEKILAQYGINIETPAYEMSFATPIMDSDGNIVAKFPNVVLFSEKQRDENGDYFYYAYSVYYGVLGRMEQITVDFLEWGLDKWVSPYLFQINIINVDTISFDSKNGYFEFKLEGEENADLTVKEVQSGYSPDIKNFRNLWQSLLAMSHDGYLGLSDEELATVTSNEKNRLLTMKAVTRSGTVQEYVFWQYTDQRVYYTINGEGEFYLPITMVNKIIADVDRFMAGEEIDPEARY